MKEGPGREGTSCIGRNGEGDRVHGAGYSVEKRGEGEAEISVTWLQSTSHGLTLPKSGGPSRTRVIRERVTSPTAEGKRPPDGSDDDDDLERVYLPSDNNAPSCGRTDIRNSSPSTALPSLSPIPFHFPFAVTGPFFMNVVRDDCAQVLRNPKFLAI